MKRIFVLLILEVMMLPWVAAQNLVPDGDFEMEPAIKEWVPNLGAILEPQEKNSGDFSPRFKNTLRQAPLFAGTRSSAWSELSMQIGGLSLPGEVR